MKKDTNVRPHRVALVLDRCFGNRLVDLAKRLHVWVVFSDVNKKAYDLFWSVWADEDKGGDELESGMSVFRMSIAENICEELLDLIPMIFDHHSPWDHDPPMTELEVYGLTINDEVQSVLDELGLTLIGSEGDALVFYSNPWE